MWRLLILGVAVLLMAVSFLMPMPFDKVVFLDVGQGDAILAESGTQQMLVDGGSGMTVLRQLGSELPWFDRTIEVVVLTHPDQDHLEGLIHALNRYHIGLVIFPRLSSATDLNNQWLQTLLAKKIPYRFAQAGESIVMHDVTVDILNPPSAESIPFMASDAENNLSTVTRVEFHNLSFLLTGDAAFATEDRMIARKASLQADVLKVGHHGSKASTSERFLVVVSPRLAVISVGKDNKYGHPTKEVLDRLKPRAVYRTDQDGAVTFQYINNQWLVKCAGDVFTNSANSCMKREQI